MLLLRYYYRDGRYERKVSVSGDLIMWTDHLKCAEDFRICLNTVGAVRRAKRIYILTFFYFTSASAGENNGTRSNYRQTNYRQSNHWA